MKKLILAIVVMASVSYAHAQTKGTNTIGVSIGSYNTSNASGANVNEQKTSNYGIGYGHFIKENVRIGFDIGFNRSKYTSNNAADNTSGKGVLAGIEYQRYFPVIKKLYAYAGGQVGYGHNSNEGLNTTQDINLYRAGAYGGITWFAFKHFAFETSLLSASALYAKGESVSTNGPTTTIKYSQFDLSSQGAINNLGFRIYFLF